MTLPSNPTPPGTSSTQTIDLVKVKKFLISSLSKLMGGSDSLRSEQRHLVAPQNLMQVYARTGLKLADDYERIAEVTKAFNKAFLYREESYTTQTILDIFKSYGYEGDD